MASYTPNYQLHQWEPQDPFLRTNFNEDLQKIDTALGALSIERIAFGSYIGDNTDSRTIQLPFAPKIAIIMGHISTYGAVDILTQEYGFSLYLESFESSSQFDLLLKENTLTVRSRNWHNRLDKLIQYILIR